MAPTSEFASEDPTTLFWLSISLSIALLVFATIILGMALRIRDYSIEKREQEQRLIYFQNAYRDSQSDRVGLQRESDLLCAELETSRQAYAVCFNGLTNASAFCRENHSSRHHRSVQSNECEFSFQAEGPDGNGPESRAGWVRIGRVKSGKPNLTAFANGEAAHHVIDGRYRVPQQIQFGDASSIDHGTDDTQTDSSVLKDFDQEPWDPNKDPDAQNDAHAGHGNEDEITAGSR
ncbi:hypothetical protein FLAG1_00968 [Fusarium langsethiae]|uniref:Uncharacterized protein n=1 Tax=Fusarium langsethiae TaxID=179993 RepID=A0A0M9F501_FUSLA|nr:hypothetical protein FLAG1_00968 [Fusarium langsethiae]GKT98245.1 unnamed protein product [Fusarium langsethiae]GKU12803.1 unnamed protein product [Fusarium langsethiae]